MHAKMSLSCPRGNSGDISIYVQAECLLHDVYCDLSRGILHILLYVAFDKICKYNVLQYLTY